MTNQPLIEEAHIKFVGSSSEMFELRQADTEVVFTVKGTVKAGGWSKQTHGVRHVMAISITKVIEGVTDRIHDTDEEPSLFDSAPDTYSKDDESPSNVVGIGQGPQFSAGD